MRNMSNHLTSALAAALMLLSWAGSSRADLTYSGSSGALSASAVFSLSGSTLTVTLTNTSTTEVSEPTDVLTAVLFNTTHTLIPVSATLPSGTTQWYPSSPLVNPGDGWGYQAGFNPSNATHNENSVIAATGAFNNLGQTNFSGASNNLAGLAYGLLNQGFTDPPSPNTGVSGHGPLFSNSVKFTLTAATGFSLTELGDSVVFQYGTASNETNYRSGPPTTGTTLQATPEPTTLGLAALGALGFMGYGLRRRIEKGQ
jgi:hypothetical protein